MGPRNLNPERAFLPKELLYYFFGLLGLIGADAVEEPPSPSHGRGSPPQHGQLQGGQALKVFRTPQPLPLGMPPQNPEARAGGIQEHPLEASLEAGMRGVYSNQFNPFCAQPAAIFSDSA